MGHCVTPHFGMVTCHPVDRLGVCVAHQPYPSTEMFSLTDPIVPK